MTLRCVRCGRRLDLPTVEIRGHAWGPKCARQAGLVQHKRERMPRIHDVYRPRRRDARQMDLFEGVAR
jgi:hypothetical protein